MKRAAAIFVLAASTVAAPGLAAAQAQTVAPTIPAPTPPNQCPAEPGSLMLFTHPSVARPGQSLNVMGTVQGPGRRESSRPGCFAVVSVAPDGLAGMSPRSTYVSVSEAARPGDSIVITASHGGAVTATLEVPVVGPEPLPLSGKWVQESVTCASGVAPGDPLRELKIEDRGFLATWQPFESYVDYAGLVTFDPGTGAVRFDVNRGNFIPPLLDAEGVARQDGDRLVLEGVYLGDRREQNDRPRVDDRGELVLGPDGSPVIEAPSCIYVFTR